MVSHTTPEDRRTCRPGTASDNIRIDRQFQALIPPLSPSELTTLQRSLDTEGCRDALIVWKGHHFLVDGHNRLRYCRDKGYPFPVREVEFPDRQAVEAYIVLQQLARRNLSPLAESYLRGKRYQLEKRQGARSDLAPDAGTSRSERKKTSQQLGEEYGVADMTIRRDGVFAKAVDQIIANCGVEARNLLLARQPGLTRGRVLEVSKRGPKEQREFLRMLQETGKVPRKPGSGRKPGRISVPRQPRALARALLEQLERQQVAAVVRELNEALERQGATT